MAKKTYTFKIGRDAKTGAFIPVKEAQRRPNTTVIETIKAKKPTKPLEIRSLGKSAVSGQFIFEPAKKGEKGRAKEIVKFTRLVLSQKKRK